VKERTNLGASVSTRLLNQARQSGADYQTLLTSYCLERFLYRLGASNLRDRFVLKGAMLLRLWADQPYRATRDLDLLRRGDGEFNAVRADLRAILAAPAPPDAVSFDANKIEVEAIRAEDEYAGVRATLPAQVGTARLVLQIDMGIGDVVSPAPALCAFPTLLDFPAPRVLAYPKEAVIAEKFEAMVHLGLDNSRLKDFYDVWYLAQHRSFLMSSLQSAVTSTFEYRGTSLSSRATVFDDAFSTSVDRQRAWQAWLNRTRLTAPGDFAGVMHAIVEFLDPVCQDHVEEKRWDPASQAWTSEHAGNLHNMTP